MTEMNSDSTIKELSTDILNKYIFKIKIKEDTIVKRKMKKLKKRK